MEIRRRSARLEPARLESVAPNHRVRCALARQRRPSRSQACGGLRSAGLRRLERTSRTCLTYIPGPPFSGVSTYSSLEVSRGIQPRHRGPWYIYIYIHMIIYADLLLANHLHSWILQASPGTGMIHAGLSKQVLDFATSRTWRTI